MKPNPQTIARILAEMADPDPEPVEPLPSWSVSAFDVDGNYQADGTGITMDGAIAAAWVHACLSDEFLGRGPHTLARLLAEVPPSVPADWTFTIDDFPAAGSA